LQQDEVLPGLNHRSKTKVMSDLYVEMEIALLRCPEGKMMHTTVHKRVQDNNGNPVGTAHLNPMLDSCMYDEEYLDRHVEELTANLIAKNLMVQVNEEGRQQMMLSSVMEQQAT
jgi:hypothetical protein